MACSTATIQQGLNLTADGIYGPNTTSAVRALQQGVGAGIDGQYGPDTSAHVAVVQTGIGTGSDGCYGPGTNRAVQVIQQGVRVGVDGFYGPGTNGGVANAQRALGIGADGIYGPQTHQAVAAFQSQHGLAADGILGPLTGNALFGAPAPPPPGPGPGPGGSFAGEGIDVYEGNGDINWNAVRSSGRNFAYVKVNQGDYLDHRFGTGRTDAMRQAGVAVGVYDFLSPIPGRDGATEARIFLDRARWGGALQPGDLAPCVDFEITQLNVQDTFNYLASWVGEVRRSYPVVIYVSPGFWNAHTPGNPGSYDNLGAALWVAHYFVSSPTLPPAWSRWDAWQYADNGNVSGVQPPTDLDHAVSLPRI